MVSVIFDENHRECIEWIVLRRLLLIFRGSVVFVFIVMTASIIMTVVFYRNADRQCRRDKYKK